VYSQVLDEQGGAVVVGVGGSVVVVVVEVVKHIPETTVFLVGSLGGPVGNPIEHLHPPSQTSVDDQFSELGLHV
jgi:hypothetical protein